MSISNLINGTGKDWLDINANTITVDTITATTYNGITGITPIAQTINGDKTFTGVTTVSNTTNSTSTITGALKVAGGIGCAKDLYCDGITTSLSASIGTSLTVNGNTTAVGTLVNTNTTDSSSSVTGALITSGGCGIGKKLYVGDALYLKTTGGTQTALDYYESYVYHPTFTGIWAADQVGTMRIVKVGAQVMIQVEALAAAANAASTIAFAAGSEIPSRFRPLSDVSHGIFVVDGGTFRQGRIRITTAGQIVIGTNASFGSFAGAGSSGISEANVFTYLV